MSEDATLSLERETVVPAMAGPSTPDDDEAYGPESDDPRAAGAYGDMYDVSQYDPSYEHHDCCGEVHD